MEIRPIHTKADYKAALKAVSALVDADPKRGTPDADRLAVLGTLLEAYEAQHFHIELPDPIEAIKFRMEQQGLSAKDLTPMIGGLNRAVMAEGLSFAEAMGIELEAFLEVLKASAAYSRTMDNRGSKMIHSDFTPHAKLSQSRKDFALMHEVAARVGQQLPLAGLYVELIESCLAHGEGDLDNSAVIRELRRRRSEAGVG